MYLRWSLVQQIYIPISTTAVVLPAGINTTSLRSECRFSTMKLFHLAQRPGGSASAHIPVAFNPELNGSIVASSANVKCNYFLSFFCWLWAICEQIRLRLFISCYVISVQSFLREDRLLSFCSFSLTVSPPSSPAASCHFSSFLHIFSPQILSAFLLLASIVRVPSHSPALILPSRSLLSPLLSLPR